MVSAVEQFERELMQAKDVGAAEGAFLHASPLVPRRRAVTPPARMRPLRTEDRATATRSRPEPSPTYIESQPLALIAPRASSRAGRPAARTSRDRSPEHPPWVGSATKLATLKSFADVDRIRWGERTTVSAERDFALHETPTFTFPGTYHPGHNVEQWRRLLAADVLIDGPLRERLLDGTIRLLKASWLVDEAASNPHLYCDARTGSPVMSRHQELPQAAFFTNAQAVQILGRRDRSILALTAAWLTPRHPDPHGTTLAAVRNYLATDAKAAKCALFWAYTCLPQPPFELNEERVIVNRARHVWGSLFGSFTATCVLRCADLLIPDDLRGDETRIDEPHTEGGAPCDDEYLDAHARPYGTRVWPRFEQTVASISASAIDAAGEGALPVRLAAAVSTRPKMVDVSGGGVRPMSAAEIAQMAPTSVRAALQYLADAGGSHRGSQRGERALVRALLADYERRVAPLGRERCSCCRWDRTHTVSDGAEPSHWGGRPLPPCVVCDEEEGGWEALPYPQAAVLA